jgi:RNA-splicing ligase RtcB
MQQFRFQGEDHRDKGSLVKAWVDGVPFEEAAREQIRNISMMPFIYKHIAIMPDVHLGATVGSVIATKGAVIPSAVGVDIGCGMMAQRLSLKASDLPDNLIFFRRAVDKVKVVVADIGESNFEGHEIVSTKDGHVWVRLGTDNSDDYYPWCVITYSPREGASDGE